MNIYSKILEVAAPVINLLRICVALRIGDEKPNKSMSLEKNVTILRADKKYGRLFNCLDITIRHSDAHASIHVDKEQGLVHLLDARGKKSKLIRSYAFSELSNTIRNVTRGFAAALFFSLYLQELSMTLLLLESPEYKYRLLALGNT